MERDGGNGTGSESDSIDDDRVGQKNINDNRNWTEKIYNEDT